MDMSQRLSILTCNFLRRFILLVILGKLSHGGQKKRYKDTPSRKHAYIILTPLNPIFI